MEENISQQETLNASFNVETESALNTNQNDEIVVEDDIELLDPVQPIEIEEGMPDDVKEAIMRFNKRTSALREVADDSSELPDEEESDSDIEEDDIEAEETIGDNIDASYIEEDDNSAEIGDLF